MRLPLAALVSKKTASRSTTPVSIIGAVLLWTFSIALLLLGLLLVLTDAFSPMQSEELAWRGWSNVAWDWMTPGLLLLLIGVLSNPLLLDRRPQKIRRWWSYGLTVIACVVALFGIINLYQDVTGRHDFELGLAAPTNQESMKYFVQAANKGSAYGAFNAGLGYSRGTLGRANINDPIVKDPKRAIAFYKLAADQGVPEAQLNLAILYINADSEEEDGHAKSDSKVLETFAKGRGLLKLASRSPDNSIRQDALKRLHSVCALIAWYDSGTRSGEQRIRACESDDTPSSKASDRVEGHALESKRARQTPEMQPPSLPGLSPPAQPANAASLSARSIAQSPASPPRPAAPAGGVVAPPRSVAQPPATLRPRPAAAAAQAVLRSIPDQERRLAPLIANAEARDATGDTDRMLSEARRTRAACATQACVAQSYAQEEAELRKWEFN